MSQLPQLSQPTPPSNTLLITDLHDLRLFQPKSLEEIRTAITTVVPLNSFSPLPSLRRIVCSFTTIEDATTIRKLLEDQSLLSIGFAPRIYFGENTPLNDRPKLLQAPQVSKLFFISPPPSPPHGWVLRNEDPPNKEVHASDLAHALSMLKTEPKEDPATPVSITEERRTPSWPVEGGRSRSSTIIFHPDTLGDSPNLPAVMVEDMTLESEDVDMEEMSPIEMSVKSAPPKTSRPPVELME
jgi:hypothetical protein